MLRQLYFNCQAFFLSWDEIHGESLKSAVDYEPPGILDELKAISTMVWDENDIFQCLEQAYVRLFINSLDGIAAPLYSSCWKEAGSMMMQL